ncbi:Neutral cholesterol ester hydrolase 1 [Holothuria leucospilota]|uniref:Neutral cholesterol ester hydrolase 1 n=1 Tax=Holothuria leucospilota TaxID=206669 RepID=A0A9Q1BPE4_HOLLE|nr:Neutral cholesterol ester hydrolase 1 [Holothuria leucospilota]
MGHPWGVPAAFSFIHDNFPTESFGPGVTTVEVTLSGTKAYIYKPPFISEQLLPAFIYFHGGGLGLASAKSYEGLAKKISSHLNAVVLNIDYDYMVSNFKFPGPVMRCFDAVKEFILHAREFGVDQSRIAIGGDSAGGYLTAVISHLVFEDKSLPDLKLQVLIYPWIHCLDFKFPSHQKYEQEFGRNGGLVPLPILAKVCAMLALGNVKPDVVRAMIENRHVSKTFKESALYQKCCGHDLLPAAFRDSSYCKDTSQPEEAYEDVWNKVKEIFLDARFTPLLRKNMTGLSPAYVMTAGFDTHRDEGYLYAQKLKKAGVDVTWVHVEKAWHGIVWMTPIISFRLGEKIQEDFLLFTKDHL